MTTVQRKVILYMHKKRDCGGMPIYTGYKTVRLCILNYDETQPAILGNQNLVTGLLRQGLVSCVEGTRHTYRLTEKARQMVSRMRSKA